MRHLTISETAEVLQLSVPTIKRYIYEGKLKSIKLPGGQHRIPEGEIQRLLSPDTEDQSIPTEGSSDERIAVLERWVTELEAEVERLSATLEVVSHYCSRKCDGTTIEMPIPNLAPSLQHNVLILGPGCQKCRALFELTTRVMRSMNLPDTSVQNVTNLDDIAAFGPVLTPALVIDNELVLSGRVPNETALRDLLQRHLS